MANNDDMREVVADLLARAAAVSSEAAEMAARGEVEGALRLEREADVIRRQARDRVSRAAKSEAPQRGAGLRDVTVAALNELAVPSSPKALSDYAQIRFDTFINYRALASLRRDEQRAWSSPRSHRPIYVLPALEGRRFLAARAKLTLSSWPLESRIIGPWSERVDHLRATLSLVKQHEWLEAHDPERAGRLVELLRRYAATIPGAVSVGEPAAVDRIRRAAEAELRQLEDDDRRWREEAAQRAQQLPEIQRLFGAPAPSAVEGGGMQR